MADQPTAPRSRHRTETPDNEPPSTAERGARGSELDRRLFVQLLAWTGLAGPDLVPFIDIVSAMPVKTVVYRDVSDPAGVALLTLSEDPAALVGPVREALGKPVITGLTPRPELTMFGRTYALGYEPDLTDTLIHRPLRHALNPDWPWAIWYPLRRAGAFEQLPDEQKSAILREHGIIGMSYGRADLAHDIRLVSHGLDRHDNDFTVGLVGRELTPLSQIVQRMRGTQQTSLYLESLGPFFVGHAAYQSPMPD